MSVREGGFAARSFVASPKEVPGLLRAPIWLRREGEMCKTAVRRFHSSCVWDVQRALPLSQYEASMNPAPTHPWFKALWWHKRWRYTNTGCHLKALQASGLSEAFVLVWDELLSWAVCYMGSVHWLAEKSPLLRMPCANSSVSWQTLREVLRSCQRVVSESRTGRVRGHPGTGPKEQQDQSHTRSPAQTGGPPVALSALRLGVLPRFLTGAIHWDLTVTLYLLFKDQNLFP